MKQAKLKLKVQIGPVLKESDPALTMDPVEPALSESKLVTRLVLVPANIWPGQSTHGWVAKVMKFDPRKNACALKFQDGTYHFNLAAVLGFKALS